ncbi:MAG TPA: DUF2585 family protein [Sphingomicrobium sp.]|nr:DUF2585 family protein [Sphingomicrobium sp.]
MTRNSRTTIAALLIFAVAAGILMAMGRSPICTCGQLALWGPVGPTQSQMLADWYSLSHIVHGLLFYAALWLVARSWPVERRFLAALAVEALWEIVENTPMVIDRYREATAALGYTGDSIVNSLSDMAMMAAGFLAARKLPLWASIVLLLALELLPLLVIRDNLLLNVWMLLAPNDFIREWQSAAFGLAIGPGLA